MKSLYVLRTGSRSAGGVAVTGTVTAGAATGCGSGAQALGHPEDARALLRPDARAEAVHRVVRLLDRLVRRAERQHAQHRTEDLLLRDPVALRDVREDGRREPVALLRQAARRLVDLRSFVASRLHELFDLVELHARVDRADVGVLVERVADAQRL